MGAGTGTSVEPGHWGRASPTSCIPVSLSPTRSSTHQLFLLGGDGILQGPGLSSDAAHSVLQQGELAEGCQGLTAAPHPPLPCRVLQCPWVFSSLLLALGLIFGLFSLSCF